jgi:multidrug transporter EmrE-like cation transporter
MRILLAVLPTVLLVAYSQIIVKWRMGTLSAVIGASQSGIHKYIAYLFDPFILSAYVAGLIGSFVWLFTVSKLPLALAFPVYQGMTFFFVVTASAIVLNEPMTSPKLIGIAMILGGVIVGTRG